MHPWTSRVTRHCATSSVARCALLLLALWGGVFTGPTAHGQAPVQPGQIRGVVFLDLNGNGQQDAGEPGIAGVTVALHSVQGTVILPVTETTTNQQGQYSFGDQPGARNYRVRITVPAGYTNTTPISVDFTLAENGEAIVNFGLRLADRILYLPYLAKQ